MDHFPITESMDEWARVVTEARQTLTNVELVGFCAQRLEDTFTLCFAQIQDAHIYYGHVYLLHERNLYLLSVIVYY